MTDPIRDALAAARAQREAAQADLEAELRREEAEDAAADEQRAGFLNACRIAEPVDYARWLAGHLKAGGKITHPYDYRMDNASHFDGSPARASWYVVTGDRPHLPTLYGAQALRLIVPAEAAVTFEDLGHNKLFYMTGFRADPDYWVPLFSDIADLLA